MLYVVWYAEERGAWFLWSVWAQVCSLKVENTIVNKMLGPNSYTHR